MVNVENPDYDMCVEKQFLLRDSRGIVRPLQWWHGSGGLLDYSNPEAVEWWHQQMDLVLDAGVDGFKCDGTDPYIDEYTLTGGALGYNDQVITYREYANSYYRDFFFHTRERRSENFPGADAGLIMSRPVDCLLDGVSKVLYICYAYDIVLFVVHADVLLTIFFAVRLGVHCVQPLQRDVLGLDGRRRLFFPWTACLRPQGKPTCDCVTACLLVE